MSNMMALQDFDDFGPCDEAHWESGFVDSTKSDSLFGAVILPLFHLFQRATILAFNQVCSHSLGNLALCLLQKQCLALSCPGFIVTE